jgi:hypothetical protein
MGKSGEGIAGERRGEGRELSVVALLEAAVKVTGGTTKVATVLRTLGRRH